MTCLIKHLAPERSVLPNMTNNSLHENNLTDVLKDQTDWKLSGYRAVNLQDITFFIKAGIALSFSKNAMLFIFPLVANCTHYFL